MLAVLGGLLGGLNEKSAIHRPGSFEATLSANLCSEHDVTRQTVEQGDLLELA